ncbi:MAG: hypothetical protein ACTSQO_03585 [Candidatus Helarchaeota archaeon]
MRVLEKCLEGMKMPNYWTEEWRNKGKKVLGYFCSYIPDEIMFAAGCCILG